MAEVGVRPLAKRGGGLSREAAAGCARGPLCTARARRAERIWVARRGLGVVTPSKRAPTTSGLGDCGEKKCVGTL